MRSFLFVSETVGYMTGNNNGGISWLFKTKDRGLTWFLVRQESENVSKVAGFKTVYVADGNALIMKTTALQKPGMPGYINGPDESCVGSKSNFITGVAPGKAGLNYSWTLSSGGSNTYTGNKDTVTWNTAGTHTLSLAVANSCGTSPLRQTTIRVISFQPTITVQDTILTDTEGSTYQWYRNGMVIPAV